MLFTRQVTQSALWDSSGEMLRQVEWEECVGQRRVHTAEACNAVIAYLSVKQI